MIKILLILFLFISCGSLPKLYQTAEDIANDEAVEIVISREAIQKQTDITISIDIKNNASQK